MSHRQRKEKPANRQPKLSEGHQHKCQPLEVPAPKAVAWVQARAPGGGPIQAAKVVDGVPPHMEGAEEEGQRRTATSGWSLDITGCAMPERGHREQYQASRLGN